MYVERTYRKWMKSSGLKFYQVQVDESDIYIGSQRDLTRRARELIIQSRNHVKQIIKKHPAFEKSLKPLELPFGKLPPMVHGMVNASQKTGVGPMAAVAGGVAQMVGLGLLEESPEIIVENGGDIFINSKTTRKVGIFAGKSPFSDKLAVKIEPEQMPLGICTSSGTVGPSLSFGKADAVVVVSKDAFLADAAATAIANIVKTPGDVDKALAQGMGIPGILGLVVIIQDKLGAAGKINLVKL